jgi:hypothetical protein
MKIRLTRRGRLLAVTVALVTIGISLGIIAPAGAAIGAPQRAGDPFEIQNVHTELCIGSFVKDDSFALQKPCNGSPDEEWHWGASTAGYEQLINGNGECLGIAGGSTSAGTIAEVWRCLGPSHRDQYWFASYDYATGPAYSLWDLNSQYVIQPAGDTLSVIQEPWDDLGSPAQYWYI